MKELTVNWVFDCFYNKEEDALKDFELIKEKNKELLNFKGKLGFKDSILEFYKKTEELAKLEEKFQSYVFLRKSLNGKDSFARELEAKYEYFAQEIEPKLAFITPELAKNKSKDLLKYADLKEFENYNLMLQNLVEKKKHILPESIDAVLSQNPSFGSNSDVFDSFNDVDLKFGKIKTEEGVFDLTHASYGKFIKHKNQSVRKNAHTKLHKGYANFNYTLGNLYLNDVKETYFFTKIHKYKSVLAKCCKADKTDPKVLSTLIEVINANLNSFYRYQQLRKDYLGLKKYYYFDNNLDIGKVDKKWSYKDTTETVLKALDCLGEEYINVLRKAFTEGWIDVYEKPGKTSGGFCYNGYGYHPFVLLNHNDTFESVSTLAHEMGHAMHAYYSCKNQPITKANAKIFICEVASIVNEILLYNYMIKNCKTVDEKLFYINCFLMEFYGTVYRQTMFSEFEYFVYSSVENQKPILVESLNNKWEELQAKYYGKGALKTPYSKYEWSRIPHFYRPYYVYKYSTGFISACTIANKILNQEKGYLDKYIKFLSAGSSIDPITLLKTVDVDITKKETLQGAFKLYDDFVEEFEKLTKEK